MASLFEPALQVPGCETMDSIDGGAWPCTCQSGMPTHIAVGRWGRQRWGITRWGFRIKNGLLLPTQFIMVTLESQLPAVLQQASLWVWTDTSVLKLWDYGTDVYFQHLPQVENSKSWMWKITCPLLLKKVCLENCLSCKRAKRITETFLD